MFELFKKKFKQVLRRVSEKVEEEEEEKKEIARDEREEGLEEKEEVSQRGLFNKLISRMTKTKISPQKFEQVFWEIELMLLENNVAYEVIEKIKENLAKELVGKEVRRGKILDEIKESIKHTVEEILIEPFDLIEEIKRKVRESEVKKEKKPYVVCFLGVNGSGKTTTLAKIAYLLKQNKLSCVFAGSDTFRAAAIQQLEAHAKQLGIKLIKHDYGADAAAVAFDAIEHAKARGIDVVLIDSAGRLHSNRNLMDELKKLVRVAKPDLKIFVGEMITGNDCIEQAQKFDEAVGIDAVILTKSDVDEKGGTAISIGYVLKKPILFLGTGQDYDDLVKFDKEKIVSALFD